MICEKNRAHTLKKAASAVLCTVLLLFSAGCAEENSVNIDEDIKEDRDGTTVVLASADGYTASDEELDAAKSILTARLDAQGVVGFDIEADYASGQLILSFPSKNADIEAEIGDVCRTGMLTFREGSPLELGEGETYEDLPLILDGTQVESADAYYDSVNGEYFVSVELTESGTEAFSEATERLCSARGIISVWVDGECICCPTVLSHITDGVCTISGGINTAEDAFRLAACIDGGPLPFELQIKSK